MSAALAIEAAVDRPPAHTASARTGMRVNRLYTSRRPQHNTLTQMFALRRLADIRALVSLRCEAGELPVSRAGVAVVLADAVSKVDSVGGRNCDAPGLAELLPREWARDIGLDVLHTAALSARKHRLLDDSTAGRLLGLTVDEVEEMATRGRVVTLHPINEDEEARAHRRASRRRKMARARNARYRKKLALERFGEKVATDRDAHIYNREASRNVATFKQTQGLQVRAAIEAGASSLTEIVAATGLTLQTIKPLLSRLTKAGQITRAGRGRYAPAAPNCRAESTPLASDMREPCSHTPHPEDECHDLQALPARPCIPARRNSGEGIHVGDGEAVGPGGRDVDGALPEERQGGGPSVVHHHPPRSRRSEDGPFPGNVVHLFPQESADSRAVTGRAVIQQSNINLADAHPDANEMGAAPMAAPSHNPIRKAQAPIHTARPPTCPKTKPLPRPLLGHLRPR